MAQENLEVKCQTAGSRPPPSITWWKGSKQIHHQSSTMVTSKKLDTADLLLKTEYSKAFIYLRVGAIIFLKNELCTEMNQAWNIIFFVFLQ